MKVTGHWPWRWLYSLLREQLGKTLNVAGFPGFVRECDYESKSLDVSVRVRISPLFTVITVRGVDVYFYRVTGKIDGVGWA